jgi:hypothetical protein
MAYTTEQKGSSGDKALLQEGKERYKLCSEAWADNRQAWLDDAKFRALDQWPEKVKKIREDAQRPCVVVDKLNQYVRQVVNDGRQNRPGVKVRPEGDGAEDDAAEAFQDLIRGICARSNADEAFDTALDHAAGNGYGFFRVITDYAHPGTFNQEILVKRVRNPRNVLLDPYIQAADGSDARFGFVEEDVPKDDYKKRWPEAKFCDWDTDRATYGEGWISEKSVRVCEYWYKEETLTTVHLLIDGTTVTDADYKSAVAELSPGAMQPVILDTREIPEVEVKWCRMSGAEILEKQEWLGKYIPLLLVIGNEQDIDGKVTYSGLIRPAKDPQRLYNYSRSAYAERVALTPKAPFIAAEGQLEGHEDEWETANTENHSVLVYKPTDVNGQPVPPPQRQSASDIPEGFARDMQMSEHDIQGSMGMYNASLGEKSNEKSGKAIMARQREGDTGTFHYPDNLNRAIRYLGRILVDLIPKVMDSRRIVHLLGEDGTPSTAEIDPEQKGAVQKYGGKKIFNFGVGVYGVDISAGPSYTTKRQEAVEAQMQMAQSYPLLMQIAGDIITRNMDWPGAEDIADRMKLMLPPPIVQAEQAKDQGQDPKVMQAVAPLKQALEQSQMQMQQMQQALQEAAQRLQGLEQEKANKQSDAGLKVEELKIKRRETEIEAYRAETERMQALAPAVSPEQVAAIVQQTVQEILTSSQPGGPPMKPPDPPIVAASAEDPQPPQGGFFMP